MKSVIITLLNLLLRVPILLRGGTGTFAFTPGKPTCIIKHIHQHNHNRLRVPRVGVLQTMAATTTATSTALSAEMSISSHLESIAKNFAVNANDLTKLNIIMGNEAGDADSIISSLALSYVNKIISGNKSGVNTSINTSTTRGTGVDDSSETETFSLSLPLASIQRNDLALRRDVVLLLQLAGIDSNHIIYMNDETFTSVVSAQKTDIDIDIHTEITLVDHNKIRSDLWYLEDRIVEILDHHQDEGAHAHVSVANDMRNIAFEEKTGNALVGSTCTLITERLMTMELDQSEKVDAGLGLILLGVILLDTMNMNEEAGKGTARDERAIEFLMDKTEWGSLQIHNDDDDNNETKLNIYGDNDAAASQPPSRSHLYEYLRDSKFDKSFWESMDPRDALRIDYKRFEPQSGLYDAFGLSSVLLSMESLVAKTNFNQDAIKYMEEANVELLGVLSMVIVDDKPQRGLLLFGTSEKVSEMTTYLLNNEAAAHLKISIESELVSVSEGMVTVKLNQGNPKGSRKQVAPLMMAQYGK